jgi:tetratricopeptide (TPR) repeat protein
MRRLLWGPVIVLLAASGAVSAEPPNTLLAQKHYESGLSLMKAESWDDAVAEFQAALKLDPYLAMAYYALGQSRMAQQRYVEAAAAYTSCRETVERIGSLSRKELGERERARTDEINELKNELQRLHTYKDINIMQYQTQIEDRIRVLQQTQYRDPDHIQIPAEIPLALGSAYFRQNKLEDAERAYKEAVSLDGKLGAAHNNLAVIYMMTGRLDDAQAEVKLAEKSGFRVNPRLKDDLAARVKAAPKP